MQISKFRDHKIDFYSINYQLLNYFIFLLHNFFYRGSSDSPFTVLSKVTRKLESMIKDLKREKYSFLLIQIITFYTQIGYILYLLFGPIPLSTAKFLIEWNFNPLNFPTRSWLLLVNSPFSTKICFLFFLLILVFLSIYLLLKYVNNSIFLIILSIINCLFTSAFVFLIITIYTHLSQLGSYIESPPYWPYFGR